MNKYDPKEKVPFADPVIRCDSCQELILRKTIQEIGCCTKCGNRRFTNVRLLQQDEMDKLKGWNVDPEFLALFGAVEDPQPIENNSDFTPPGEVAGGCLR